MTERPVFAGSFPDALMITAWKRLVRACWQEEVCTMAPRNAQRSLPCFVFLAKHSGWFFVPLVRDFSKECRLLYLSEGMKNKLSISKRPPQVQ